MKIKGFLEDISGIKRITKARLDAIKNAPDDPIPEDPIHALAMEWHPGELELQVSEIRGLGGSAKSFRLRKPDGSKLPLFLPGQYLVLTLEIDGKPISRPYSISSAPASSYRENGFVEITVKKPRSDGFFADYLLKNVQEGDMVRALIGCGEFHYEPLRDAPHILALAGGIGITPFVSIARAIADGTLDISMTILYGVNAPEELVLWNELRALEQEIPEKFQVVPVFADTLLQDRPDYPFEQGFLSAKLIQKYLKTDESIAPDTSLFICGPQAMYRYLQQELPKLDIPKRRIRFEVFGQVKDIGSFEGYPKDLIGETFRMTVHRGIQEDVIPARAKESIAAALERAGIRLETGCRSGECGFCRTKVLSGSYFVCPENDGRRAADKEFNYVHACAAYPLSDLEIRIPIA